VVALRLCTTCLGISNFSDFVIFGYFIAGLSIGGWEAYWVTAVQREVPQELQGRVFSIDMVGTSGLMPLGMALVGPIIALTGERDFPSLCNRIPHSCLLPSTSCSWR
jgi:hypothetical protein